MRLSTIVIVGNAVITTLAAPATPTVVDRTSTVTATIDYVVTVDVWETVTPTPAKSISSPWKYPYPDPPPKNKYSTWKYPYPTTETEIPHAVASKQNFFPPIRYGKGRSWAVTMGFKAKKCSRMWNRNDYYRKYKTPPPDLDWSIPQGKYKGQCAVMIPAECTFDWKDRFPFINRTIWPEYCSDPETTLVKAGKPHQHIVDLPTEQPGRIGHMVAHDNDCLTARHANDHNCQVILDVGNWGPTPQLPEEGCGWISESYTGIDYPTLPGHMVTKLNPDVTLEYDTGVVDMRGRPACPKRVLTHGALT